MELPMGLKTMVGGRRSRGAATADVDTIRRPSTVYNVKRPPVENHKRPGKEEEPDNYST